MTRVSRVDRQLAGGGGSRIRLWYGLALIAIGYAAMLVAPDMSIATVSEIPGETPGTGWEVTSTTFPTNFAPAGGTGVIEITLSNIGAASSSGPVTVTDTLPPGMLATEAGDLQASQTIGLGGLWDCSLGGGHVVTCTSDEKKLSVIPIPQPTGTNAGPQGGAGHFAHIGIAVKVQTEEEGTLSNQVTVAGGGAIAPASTATAITISSAPAAFGLQDSDAWASSADGSVDTQAGSHPYDFTYIFNLNSKTGEKFGLGSGGIARDLTLKLPPGMIGNPQAVPRCTRQQFEEEDCPPSTQVGVDMPELGSNPVPSRAPGEPVYNLVPPPGIAAQFALSIYNATVYLDASVRSGGDYGITAHVDNLPQVDDILSNTIQFWGEPADPAHNEDRTSTFYGGSACKLGCGSAASRIPFLTLPTSCSSVTPTFYSSVTAWESAGLGELTFGFHDNNGTPTGFTGCDHLEFRPSISVEPDTSDADTPTGLTVDVRVPQEGLTAQGALATSNIKDTTVVLPKGVVINPGQAAGLQACQEGDVIGGDDLPLAGEDGEEERFSGPPDCPKASKVGEVKIATPLLSEDLEGDVYVLRSNPPNLKLLVAASGEGVNLKLIGNVHLDENTGQLSTTFSETPELPFTDLKLSFSGGAQAALATPVQCGEKMATSDFTPWSTPEVGDVFPSSNFAVDSGPSGSGCPSSPLPFTPSMIAGSTNPKGGAFTSFSLLLQNGDGQQRTEKLQFKTPRGLSGMISTVPLCQEPLAAEGKCSEGSKIGHATVASGPGPYPLVIPQPGDPESPIYLTGPYNGTGACTVGTSGCAPFGLAIVTHVLAGPFNLGTIITRGKLEVDPHTAQITITTNPLPQVVDGVPTDLRLVNSVIDRPGFMFNPTHCASAAFAGTAWGTPPPGVEGQGSTAGISSSFDVVGCKGLAFAPGFKVSTSGKTSKARGASLNVKILYPKTPPGSQATNYANIASAKVDLPKQLPSRLTTLQKACTAAQFEVDPAGCPAASVIGHARVITPLLPVPVEGPAYFVSHGGEAFPSLIMVLQGYGVTVDLVGTTFISKAGITSSTFKSTPDVPLSSFELTLPQGKYSALAANGDLCTSKLAMPTAFVGQNGAEIHESTKIAVTGCAKAKALTRAQKLTKALKVCHAKRGRKSRTACEVTVHKRYGPVRSARKTKRSGNPQ
jgi:uncharacterized repeat protein (TIGR01451 family)